MEIIVDTREQKPLWIGSKYRKLCLYVGDYTTEDLYNIFHVERKSAQDLYSTITKGHVRFRDELIRAEVHGIKLVMVVECAKKYFINKEFPGGHLRQFPSTGLEKIIKTIEERYKLKIYWCKTRETAKKKITSLFKEAEDEHRKRSARKNKTAKRTHSKRK